MKKTLKTALFITLIILTGILAFKSVKYYKESVREKQPVYITDTITNVIYDTVFLDHYKTVKLYLTDTLTNTVIKDSLRIDSVFVQIPISSYRLDTTLITDSTVFNLSLRNKGYLVSLDTLSYSFSYNHTLPSKRHRTGFFIGPSIGITYYDSKILPTVGIGVGFGLSTGKW